MKKIAALVIAGGLMFSMAGCNLDEESQAAKRNRVEVEKRYALCLEHGGTYVEDLANGWECYAEGVNPNDFKK